MKLKKQLFGKHQDQDVFLFTLSNDNGLVVKVMTYGATITSIEIPRADGKTDNIVCGFDTFEGYFGDSYVGNSPYFGCTVGRYCSQIKDAKFTLDGVAYQLASNAGDNNIHGGKVGFDKVLWNAETIEKDCCVGVIFSRLSPHLEEGFPGNVQLEVKMTLNNDNEIKIDYKGITDQATPLSMTNHTYFNLNGFTDTVEKHVASVFTNNKLELDSSGASTGKLIDVTGAADDMQKGQVIGAVHEKLGDGFEHFFVFDNDAMEMIKVAEISEPETGRSLKVSSKEPCMLLYTGKYTSDEIKREDGTQFGKYRGFCCETHRWQNGPNIEGSPKTITTPDEKFETSTVFKLNW